MATRTIQLKLVIPRNDDVEHREALWATHEIVNDAAAYYERQLVLMRQREYESADGLVSKEDVCTQLRSAVESAQKSNGKAVAESLDEACELLRQLYEMIVPSTKKGETGTAKEGNAFIGPLADPGSEGKLLVFKKLDRPRPNWLGKLKEQREEALDAANAWLATSNGQAWRERVDKRAHWVKEATAGERSWPQLFCDYVAKQQTGEVSPDWCAGLTKAGPDILSVAEGWLESETGKTWMSDTGTPTRWRKAATDGSPSWPLEFIAKLEELELEAKSGSGHLVKRLRELGALPLFSAFMTPRIKNARSGLTPWDRLAFRLAVGHLLSWESWCHRTADEHGGRVAKLKNYRAEQLVEAMAPAMAQLDGYETSRSAFLSGRGLGESVYQVRPRQLRGWDDLCGKWRKSKDKSEASLCTIVAEENSRNKNRFGDLDLYGWMAKPENHVVWQDGPKALVVRAAINAMQSLVERSREQPILTGPDAILHPVWAQWEPLGGTNLKKYRIGSGSRNSREVNLPLLAPRGDSEFEDKAFNFQLASSGQLSEASFSREGKKNRIEYRNDAGEVHHATLQASDLYFERRHLENRGRDRLAQGDIGRVYFKLVMDVDPALPPGWDAERPAALRHFGYSSGKKTGLEKEIDTGFRILSVDLGLRRFASCSVFELKTAPDVKRLSFRIVVGDTVLHAVHERSFHLKLPDESVSSRAEHWRVEQMETLRRLRRNLYRYRRIMSLALIEDPAERAGRLADVSEGLEDEAEDSIDETVLISKLNSPLTKSALDVRCLI